MAYWKEQGKSVVVEKGDNLWRISETYFGGGSKYKQLAQLNGIPNPDLIYPGQVIKVDGSSGGSTGPTSSNSLKPTILQFGPISTQTDTLFATWKFDREKDTENYKVQWTYDTGDGVWFVGDNGSISVDEDDPSVSRQDTFNIPTNATAVKFKVKPISKKKKSGDTEVNIFEGQWSDVQTYTNETPMAAPSTPTVKLDKLTLIASIDNIDIPNATGIQFEVAMQRSTVPYKKELGAILNASASVVFTLRAGDTYSVRARAYNSKTKLYGDWSDYSSWYETIPEPPLGITTIQAKSETSVYLEWEAAIESTASTYDIEYATKEEYFDGSDQTTTRTGIEFTHYELSGLTSGNKYFFRVRAVNDSGPSSWTPIKSVVIGTKPAAPTTWSSTTTVITGETLTLFWVHNSEDGSSQTYADLELYVDGEKVPMELIKNTEDEELKDKTSSYEIDTTPFIEGTKIQWRVRTRGVTNQFGDWSIQRTVDVYAPPTLVLKVTDINGNLIENLTSFPFYVHGTAAPHTQTPIGYHLTVTSNDIYETSDNVGNVRIINVGDQVYSKYFDIENASPDPNGDYSMLVEMSANNIDLENNVEYTVTCVVSMNSGLTAEASSSFTVYWEDLLFAPTASVGINTDNLTASIIPVCEDRKLICYKVTYANRVYTKTDETVGWMFGDAVKGAKTKTGESVYTGITVDGDEIYYCVVEEITPVEDVYLSVYRREFDGSFTELATGLDGAMRTTVIDPHPALDFARYRIVAISKSTGSVSFTDLPGHPVNGKSVIIQWDDTWTNFEVTEDAELERPAWNGSLLKLPYNIDVSDSNKADVSLVEYIGRAHPVSYYGTQLGQSSTWNVEIPKADKETIYALRRLSRWMGDVYVREPSGSGYWANITVSFNQKHKAVTIPVTLNVTRVEGGA